MLYVNVINVKQQNSAVAKKIELIISVLFQINTVPGRICRKTLYTASTFVWFVVSVIYLEFE